MMKGLRLRGEERAEVEMGFGAASSACFSFSGSFLSLWIWVDDVTLGQVAWCFWVAFTDRERSLYMSSLTTGKHTVTM